VKATSVERECVCIYTSITLVVVSESSIKLRVEEVLEELVVVVVVAEAVSLDKIELSRSCWG